MYVLILLSQVDLCPEHLAGWTSNDTCPSVSNDFLSRQADLGQSSRAAIKGVVDYVREHRGAPPGARTAIVAGRDLDYGLARMYEQLLEAGSPADVMVFRSMEEALAWLGRVPVEDKRE